MTRSRVPFLICVLLLVVYRVSAAANGFVNFETPHVHPLDLSPDRNTLAAVNTADHRLLLFDVATGSPRLIAAIAVGLDPVSARFRSNGEVWVVNQLSDSVSVVDVATRRVRATLQTLDEPADVAFAGSPERAFVSCSAVDRVLVFDPDDLGRSPRAVRIDAEEPRAMAASADGGLTPSQLTARARLGRELTFTVVPRGSADLIAGSLGEKRRHRRSARRGLGRATEPIATRP